MATKSRSRFNFLERIWYSFPAQLIINHLKRNYVLLFAWFIFFLIISSQFGRYLGIPFLFLDPEYLDEVSFTSFFIMGFVMAGFATAFNITTYIMDGPRFPFLGALSKPFSKFSINNAPIPIVFLVWYIFKIVRFQSENEFATTGEILTYIAGLLFGYTMMIVVMMIYVRFTNKDIFKMVANTFDEKLKKRIRMTRARVMERVQVARAGEIKVNSYLGLDLKIRSVSRNTGFQKETITKVFDQNHLNLVIMELFIFILLLFIGVFREYPAFQIPAAASFVLFFSVIVMFIGAFSYWFGRWAVAFSLGLFLVINILVREEFISTKYQAFGLIYDNERVGYTLENIRQQNSLTNIKNDQDTAIKILNNWKAKFPEDAKPKAIFICVSGGGQRAALWTVRALQEMQRFTEGKLFDQSVLITGASGGIIGASYFRELYLRNSQGSSIDPLSDSILDDISRDNLNPIIFSFLVNDLFVKFQNFEYSGIKYPKDRGYSFEEQINKNTRGLLNKPLEEYRLPERNGEIPMMILAPTIINDGRKLFISPHNVSFMNIYSEKRSSSRIPQGIDFRRFYENQNSENIRFLSALRMNATFPYITPNITLPSVPSMEIMDAGISDNFGISDALRFAFSFRTWLEENTSGIIILSIRDSRINVPIASLESKSLVKRISKPISSIYVNFENLQEISNSNEITYAKEWFNGEIDRIDLQYIPQSLNGDGNDIQRASLSWRLTTREKEDIRNSIKHQINQQNIEKLKALLNE